MDWPAQMRRRGRLETVDARLGVGCDRRNCLNVSLSETFSMRGVEDEVSRKVFRWFWVQVGVKGLVSISCHWNNM